MEEFKKSIVNSPYLGELTKEKLLASIEANNFSETITLLYTAGYGKGHFDAFCLYV